MMITLMFLFLGFLFVVLEFYLPGGIMAVLGTIMLISSVILFATTTESAGASFSIRSSRHRDSDPLDSLCPQTDS